jgi:hypothetical protein
VLPLGLGATLETGAAGLVAAGDAVAPVPPQPARMAEAPSAKVVRNCRLEMWLTGGSFEVGLSS